MRKSPIDPFIIEYDINLCDEEFDYQLHNGILVQRAAHQLVRAEISSEDFLEVADYYLPGQIDQYLDEISDNIERCLLIL